MVRGVGSGCFSDDFDWEADVEIDAFRGLLESSASLNGGSSYGRFDSIDERVVPEDILVEDGPQARTQVIQSMGTTGVVMSRKNDRARIRRIASYYL